VTEASDRSTIMWRRLDMPGHEVAELTASSAGWELQGVALFAHEGQPCRLEYRIACDAEWRTRSVRVDGRVGGTVLALELTRSDQGEWEADGRPAAALHGCIDVDLGFSPSTNLLPIRRLGLAVGDRAAVRAAWVQFPTLSLQVLEQVYARLETSRYRYESAGGTFRRDLTVGDAGWVTEYPDFWQVEAMTTAESIR
jgi:hypothetical protein